ncbi:MAG TPA: 50S ribosomal protein L6 [Anaerolineae bacterium]|nr:50S ribosomal protein L6 [Anaerolineae bacterium]HMR62425.1 50S ribosomal protein L6 [Anaerolineae bacterium]
MSRIGKLPVPIPPGVTVNVDKNTVTVKGPKGQLTRDFLPEISLEQNDGQILVTRNSDHRLHKARHGLTRALLNNMILGVTEGFKRQLQIEGVGYRAAVQGKNLVLNVGYSHPVTFEPPADVLFDVPDRNGREIVVSGIDKEVVGEIAAQIRRVRPPEPYKGKGIRYAKEQIRRKAGKAGKAK